jgi:Ca-activated chloride channel homolog
VKLFLHTSVAGRLASLAVASLFLMASIGPPTIAQEGPGTIRVASNLVLLDTTVKDKSGRVVDGLKQTDFEVREDGVPQTISHFSRDQLPLAVALVVDLSSSIQPFLRPLRYATATALRSLKPEDEVAMFTFTDRVERRVDLTRDKHAASDPLETFAAGGSTNINGGIYEAANYLREQAPAARRVIILVSDNVPTDGGGISPKKVEDAVLEADAGLFSLRIPGDNPGAVRLMARVSPGLVNVSKLADDTGGEIFDVEKQGSLYLAFEALIERLKTRYTLGYAPTHPPDARFHKLEVHLVGGRGTPGQDYKVVAKRGYYAGSAGSKGAQ